MLDELCDDCRHPKGAHSSDGGDCCTAMIWHLNDPATGFLGSGNGYSYACPCRHFNGATFGQDNFMRSEGPQATVDDR